MNQSTSCSRSTFHSPVCRMNQALHIKWLCNSFRNIRNPLSRNPRPCCSQFRVENSKCLITKQIPNFNYTFSSGCLSLSFQKKIHSNALIRLPGQQTLCQRMCRLASMLPLPRSRRYSLGFVVTLNLSFGKTIARAERQKFHSILESTVVNRCSLDPTIILFMEGPILRKQNVKKLIGRIQR